MSSHSDDESNSQDVQFSRHLDIHKEIKSLMTKMIDLDDKPKKKRKRTKSKHIEDKKEMAIEYKRLVLILKYEFMEFESHHVNKELGEGCINTLFQNILRELSENVTEYSSG